MDANQVSRVGDEEAARWFARLRAPGCPPSVQRQFHAWLQAHPDHPAAYERAMLAAQRISLGFKDDPELQAMLDDALAQDDTGSREDTGRSWFTRWRLHPVGLGMFAVLCLLLAGQSWQDPAPTAEPVQVLVNTGHVRREVRLDDGSRVLLDVGARVEVQMRPEARRLTLLAGRAYFKVAPDKTRPFTVDTGVTRTTALGTEFEVDVRGDGNRVTLAEGSVAVTATDGRDSWSRRLVPGQQLVSHPRQAPETRRVDVPQTLGWSTGQLHFQNTALADVVSEWNRYARVRVTLGDTRLAETRIVGTFAAGGNSGEFVTALASVLPIRVLNVGPEEILLVRDY